MIATSDKGEDTGSDDEWSSYRIDSAGLCKTPVSEKKAMFFTVGEIERARSHDNRAYREFLRVPALSAGLYVLAAGATDAQRPHHEDEMYYVVRGRARFKAGEDDHEVSAGSVIYVAAEVEHRFYNIEQELAVLVFFAPAET